MYYNLELSKIGTIHQHFLQRSIQTYLAERESHATLPLTVLHVQACIDMNKVMEVARADEVTGNPYSVAITAPERIHFVKGTCKEESNWWLEVLQIFPR